MIKKIINWCMAWQKKILFPFSKTIPEEINKSKRMYALKHGDWTIGE